MVVVAAVSVTFMVVAVIVFGVIVHFVLPVPMNGLVMLMMARCARVSLPVVRFGRSCVIHLEVFFV